MDPCALTCRFRENGIPVLQCFLEPDSHDLFRIIMILSGKKWPQVKIM